ncbi:hybrid sensor histidine kinase/response regulator [Natronolimnohabitans innermongolicus]|uniref:histidine kinase n=1 Tax=Natronolimnohabitans innermongolicus JCM 12255 TaxID=1227499 RepID=L9WLT7_9EURY|nr:hybrid sensor histidine kinase/response regulator [Natronolimnohabitans innermongolicus]ELY50181.1 signal-transducing histidine kinase-like protein [Natronolimnohabitans innermongolicus JCM 12255]
MATTETGTRLLLVEDNHDDARFVERLIRERQSTLDRERADSPIEITAIRHVDRLAAALEHLETAAVDVILLDLMLPDSRGLETIERVVEYAPDVPIVVLTGQNETEVGVEAIQRGAQEYLSKGSVTGETILRTVRYAIERSRNQRRLVDRNHRLAVLNQIVRQDIRNDLSMIVGLGDQLQNADSPADERAVETLLDAARHAVELTDTAAEVIDVISTDGPNREPCDLYAVLETEVTTLRRKRDVDVTLARGDAGDGPVIVSASPMLGAVFEHLLVNAVDHSERPTPQVTVTVETTPEEATVEIVDDGVGIPDAQKRALVDPDARFDTRSGMGVGLYLVTTLLESMGGTLEVDDNDPCGTSVTVAFSREGSPTSRRAT